MVVAAVGTPVPFSNPYSLVTTAAPAAGVAVVGAAVVIALAESVVAVEPNSELEPAGTPERLIECCCGW